MVIQTTHTLCLMSHTLGMKYQGLKNNNNPLYSFVDKPLRYASLQLTRRTALDKPWHAGQVQPTTGLSMILILQLSSTLLQFYDQKTSRLSVQRLKFKSVWSVAYSVVTRRQKGTLRKHSPGGDSVLRPPGKFVISGVLLGLGVVRLACRGAAVSQGPKEFSHIEVEKPK